MVVERKSWDCWDFFEDLKRSVWERYSSVGWDFALSERSGDEISKILVENAVP